MLSSLPKLADKNFIIGFFLPALLMVVSTALAFPGIPGLGTTVTAIASEKSLTDLTFLVLGVWVLAVLLLTANHFQYRFLEGYIWPLKSIKWLRDSQKRRSAKMQQKVESLQKEWLIAERNKTPFPAAKQAQLARLQTEFLSSYPSVESELLPTSFGNTIRAFEVYPRDVYGADSISVWLRLGSVVSKEFLGQIDDARAQVDFFVNTCFLSALFSLVSLLGLIGAIAPELRSSSPTRAAVAAVLGFAVASLGYKMALDRVAAWGDLVKSAFDCYLPALAKQVGFTLPRTANDRRAFWTAFSQMVLYREVMNPENWPPAIENIPKSCTKPDDAAKSGADANSGSDADGASKSAEDDDSE